MITMQNGLEYLVIRNCASKHEKTRAAQKKLRKISRSDSQVGDEVDARTGR